jgi:hypothetical protein
MQVTLKLPGGFSFTGSLAPCQLDDLWLRVRDGLADDPQRSGLYQSVLMNVSWSSSPPPSCSPVLQQLWKLSSAPGAGLSIRFVLDNYNNNNHSEAFTLGRVTGTIGVHNPNEPTQVRKFRYNPTIRN